MGKLKDIFTNQKELPQWVLPLIFLVWFFMEITEYGHRPFVEGFMEDPLNLYIVLGGFLFLVIIFFVKQKEKKEVDEVVDKPHEDDKSSKNSNSSVVFIIVVWILVMILGYFNTKSSKETEKRVEDFMEQKKMEQIDPHSQE